MTYLEYVVAAYGVFAVAMLWEFFAPWLQVRAQLRAARLRGKRAASGAHPVAADATAPPSGDARP